MRAQAIVLGILTFIVTAASSLPARAEQSAAPGVQPAPIATFTGKPRDNPYARLFKTTDVKPVSEDADGLKQPTVLCGTLAVPVDAAIDAKMRKPVPQDEVSYAIRAVKPPICQSTR